MTLPSDLATLVLVLRNAGCSSFTYNPDTKAIALTFGAGAVTAVTTGDLYEATKPKQVVKPSDVQGAFKLPPTFLPDVS